jgi:DNA-binding CsgD family transcriptional regulator
MRREPFPEIDINHPNISPEPSGGCWIWTAGVNGGGYGCFKRLGRVYTVHRTAYEQRNGQTNKWVLHKCDNRRCCNPDHLYTGDVRDNGADMARRNRNAQQRRLDAASVRVIRQLSQEGESQMQLARRFGVGRHTVREAIAGRTWRHV